MDTLQAAILIAWAEYKSGRGHGTHPFGILFVYECQLTRPRPARRGQGFVNIATCVWCNCRVLYVVTDGAPFWFPQLAMQTATAIGLSEESSLQLSPYDPYQNRLRITWSSLNQLRVYASSCHMPPRESAFSFGISLFPHPRPNSIEILWCDLGCGELEYPDMHLRDGK